MDFGERWVIVEAALELSGLEEERRAVVARAGRDDCAGLTARGERESRRQSWSRLRRA